MVSVLALKWCTRCRFQLSYFFFNASLFFGNGLKPSIGDFSGTTNMKPILQLPVVTPPRVGTFSLLP